MKSVIQFILSVFLFWACTNGRKNEHSGHENKQVKKEVYTCPMHPQIVRDQPGKCPICGMDLIKKEVEAAALANVDLQSLLKPTNEFVISTIPVTTIKKDQISVEVNALGRVEYDTRMIGTISARINGRIEKLYVRSKYQYIRKGQKVMDIYSPELLTAQQNLLFVQKNDPANASLLQAAKQRLLLLGVTSNQVSGILKTGKTSFSVSIYSNYTGHLHDAGKGSPEMNQRDASMGAINASTELLSLKEGMYVQRGQTLFSIYNPSRAWASLNIYTDGQALIKKDQQVKIIPETASSQAFQGKIDFIEPFFRNGTRTITVRVYFDNSSLRLPVGSQVRGVITAHPDAGYWLPKASVVSLGLDKVVFLKEHDGFRAKKIATGLNANNSIQVLGGLSETDSVAMNAQFLTDSESFIKVKE